MILTSVNLGKAQPLALGSKPSMTGIYKQPLDQPALLTRLGLVGDAVCDVKNHGGPDQAVYIYGGADYQWWEAELGQPLAPGTFGENLTIDGLESAQYAIGDRLQIGAVVLEVTSPRIPCGTLAARMGSNGFAKRFRLAGRPGLYCRVIAEGTLERGMPVICQPYPGERVLALALFENYYQRKQDASLLRRFLAAPVAERARADLQKRLKRLAPE